MTDLQEAFREAARREFAMVPDESELDYTFSYGFQRKMRRIIRAQVHGYWNMVNTLGKRIAIAAAIIVMLLTTAMAIKPIRERVIKFFVEIYEEYFEITFGEEERGDLDSPPTVVARYTFSWVPEEYYEEHRIEGDPFIFTEWNSDEKGSISLYQATGTNTITIDNTDSHAMVIEHGELFLHQLTYDETIELVWEQDGYIFHLIAPNIIPFDEVLLMIDSLRIIEK